MSARPGVYLDVTGDLTCLPGETPAWDYLGTFREALARLRGRAQARKQAQLQGWISLLERAPVERHGVIVRALQVLYNEALAVPAPIVPLSAGHLLPEYPHASLTIQARLVLGETPVQVSGPRPADRLTRKEAHAWLSEGRGDISPAEWLIASRRDLIPMAHLPPSLQSVAVVRWVHAVISDPPRAAALCRAREERGPHGEVVHGSYLDRVDELRAQDLRPSVEETFRVAGARMLKDVERALRKRSEPLSGPPRWWKPARCATLLLTGGQLLAEGKTMEHCSAQYAGYVRRGDSVLVSLAVPERLPGETVIRRSTVELRRSDARVLQHRGYRNGPPPEVCARALVVLLKRWRANKEASCP